MQVPLQIVFRDLGRSDAIEAEIRQKVEKLEQFYDRMLGCRVTVGIIQKHKHQGKLFNIRIDVTVPGAEFVINRDKAEDVYVAIRDAFDAMKRKLDDHARRQRGEVKTHESEATGRIARLFGDEGYGFIEKPDGAEVYFHVYNLEQADFQRLQVGDEVTFLEEPGGEGTQANRIRLRRHS